MPTAEVQRLTEAFRTAEARRAALVAAAVAVYFQRRVDIESPESVERWLAALVPLILREQAASASRGSLFGNTLRTLELGVVDDFRFQPVEVADLVNRVRTSLMVTGPTALRSRIDKISGMDVSPAEETALIRTARERSAAGAAASAARHIQSGARESLRDGIVRDPLAIGYIRVTRPNPCYFCAMLASRGAVYKDDSFDDSDPRFVGDGDFKVHDSCGCTLAPTYHRRDDFFTDDARRWSEQWGEVTKGTSGKGSLLAWRRAYESR